MATQVDELITRYSLDAKSYIETADKVTHATKGVTDQIERLGGGVFGGLKSALSGVIAPITGLLGAAGAGGLIGLIGYSMEAANKFDFMTRSLTAVTGSAQRAGQVLAFVDKLAIPSIFTSEDLATASVRLEAFKLKTEEFLPVAEKLGTIFGGTKEDLMEYVDALGKLKAGESGRALEALKRGSISQQDLAGKGISFTKGGELIGSTDAALAAVEGIVNQRFGRLSKEMADSPMAKMASVMDAIGRAARQAGFVFLGVLAPAMERVGNFVQYLVDSKAIESVTSGFTNLFKSADLGGALISGLAWLMAALKNLPTVIQGVERTVGGLFAYLHDNLRTIGRLIIAVFTFGPALQGLMAMVEAWKAMKAAEVGATFAALALKGVVGGLKGLGIALLAGVAAAMAGAGLVAAIDAASPKIPGISDMSRELDQVNKDQASLMNGFKQTMSASGGAAPGLIDTLSASTPISQIAAATKQTAENTKRALEIQRAIIGGAAVGRLGITPSELGAIKRGSGSRGSGLDGAIDHLVHAIRLEMGDTFQRSAMQARRAGMG